MHHEDDIIKMLHSKPTSNTFSPAAGTLPLTKNANKSATFRVLTKNVSLFMLAFSLLLFYPWKEFVL